MSNSPWPPQQPPRGRDPRQPFGQPSAPAGRDPRQPFLQDGQHAREFQQHAPPARTPLWPWVVGVVALIGVVILAVALWPANEPEPIADQPAPSAFPSPTVTGNAIQYEGNGTGVIEITNHAWTDQGLRVDFTITPDNDNADYFQVFVFANDTRKSYDPDNMELIEVSATRPASRTVVFDMPRADATFVLASSGGRAITALPIQG